MTQMRNSYRIFGIDNLEDAKEAYRLITLECPKIFVEVTGTAALVCGGPLYHTSVMVQLDKVEVCELKPKY